MSRKQDYKVTDASVFTVHPVVTEHRYQMIEEIKPPKSNSLMDIICGIVGLAVIVFVGCGIFGLIANLLGFDLK